MVAKIIVCLVVAALLYAYTNHNREFTATASAIRQIWSGSCHLSCRHSGYSGFSGLSGLVQHQSPGFGSRLSDQVKVGQTSTSINSQAGPSYSCVCESCPCAVLEKVLRTCSPATDLYFEFIEMLSNIYYEIVKALTDLYVYIERVVDCGATCRRPAQNKQSYNKVKNLKGIKFQLTSVKLNSADNNNVEKASSSVKDDTAEKRGKEILDLKPSAISFPRQSEDEFSKTELHSSTGGHNIAINLGRDSLMSKPEPKETAQVGKGCSKCIEKGKVCMNNCPRSKVKK